ncbi:MAG: hypothetical protein GIW96_11900 [Candidatus Eremiobacteraeota bacterium]|nr:hypothetical protein [Candidatus Eremiobacteraeota bacterium]
MTSVVAAPVPIKTPFPAAVLGVTTIKANEAATVLHSLYPKARIRVDRNANAIIVVASPDDVNAMRTILSGIDVKNPLATTATAVPLHNSKAPEVIARLRALSSRSLRDWSEQDGPRRGDATRPFANHRDRLSDRHGARDSGAGDLRPG